jgi:small conductance mechanosensitive channel
VRSEAAKHRQAVAQVLTWVAIALIWSITGVLVLDRLGVPVASLVAPAAVLGAALGFGAQQVVRDLIAGFFIIVERQYGFGDVVHISAVGFVEGATGTIEEVALRTTRLRRSDGAVVVVPNGLIVQTTTSPARGPGPWWTCRCPPGWTCCGPTSCSAGSGRRRSRTRSCGRCSRSRR